VLALNKIDLPRPHASRQRNPDGRVSDLLRDVEMRRVFIFSGLQSMAWDLFTFAIPIYGSRIGFSASTIGLILGSFSAATFAIRLLLPLFARRVSPWTVMSASLLVAGVAFTCFPLFTSAGLMMAVSFVLGLGLGASQPMVLSLMHTTAPEGRVGEAIGIRSTLINGSQMAMPLAFGALGSALGMAPVFWTSALLMFWGGYFARRGTRGRRE
jgi:predicted MFS family arabinose efflux permease